MNEDSSQPPFKRGKVLPSRDILQEAEEKVFLLRNGDFQETRSSCIASSWSSSLTPHQRKCWTRLLQQRKTPVPHFSLCQLPADIVFCITNFLDAPSLLKMRCLNQKYRKLCSRDEAGWSNLCLQRWYNKVHISEEALRLASPTTVDNFASGTDNNGNNRKMMDAYRISIRDAVNRQSVTFKELCYNPASNQGTVWSFRFKESAGSDWTAVDPWYSGEPCRKMVFLQDGSVKQFCPGSSKRLQPPRFGTSVVAASERADFHTNNDENPYHAHRFDAVQVNNYQEVQNFDRMVDPPMTMTWRFITRPMDLPTRPMGSYVRVTVGGRDVPTYAVRRSPTGNWGFIMESCWGLFASFDLPPRRIPQPVPRTSTESVLRRTSQGTSLWLDVEVDELDFLNNGGDEELDMELNEIDLLFDETPHNGRVTRSQRRSQQQREPDPMLALQDESTMVISNDVQWREAFLYNVGARTLPEGDEATNEFDRAWGRT